MTAPPLWQPAPPQHPRVGPALTVSIVALAGGLVVLPLALGPLAWFLGVRAMREIDQDPDRWSGRSTARTAAVLGAVATGLLVAALVLIALIGVGLIALAGYDSGYPT